MGTWYIPPTPEKRKKNFERVSVLFDATIFL